MNLHTQKAFGLTILKSNHPDIRRLKKGQPKHILHGNKVWKSSFLMMDYLSEYPLASSCRVLEVGCGWGLASLYCAKHFDAEVVALDADEQVLPFAEHHAAINEVQLNTIAMDINDITEQQLAGFDVLIGTDICFWDSLIEPINTLVDKAKSAGVERTIFSDPGRPSFRMLADHCQQNQAAFYSDWAVPAPLNLWGLVLEIPAEP